MKLLIKVIDNQVNITLVVRTEDDTECSCACLYYLADSELAN